MTDSVNELNTKIQRLLDENAILNLIARFDNAVIRQDIQAFRDLWVANSVWEIGEPIPMRAEGVIQIVTALQKFNDINEFFFRTTSRAVIALDGDRATAVAPTTEYARRHDGHGYNNVALWQDEFKRQDDNWLFVSRRYSYIWVDKTSLIPGDAVALSESLMGQ